MDRAAYDLLPVVVRENARRPADMLGKLDRWMACGGRARTVVLNNWSAGPAELHVMVALAVAVPISCSSAAR